MKTFFYCNHRYEILNRPDNDELLFKKDTPYKLTTDNEFVCCFVQQETSNNTFRDLT